MNRFRTQSFALGVVGFLSVLATACSTEVDGKNKALEKLGSGAPDTSKDAAAGNGVSNDLRKGNNASGEEGDKGSSGSLAVPVSREIIKETNTEVKSILEKVTMGQGSPLVTGLGSKIDSILASKDPSAAQADVVVLSKQVATELKASGAINATPDEFSTKVQAEIIRILGGASLTSLSKEDARLVYEMAILNVVRDLSKQTSTSGAGAVADAAGLPVTTPTPDASASPGASTSGSTSTSVATTAVAANDTHVIARNNVTREHQVWKIDAAGKVVGKAPIVVEGANVDARPLNSPGWKYVGSGDLDGDGQPDLFFRFATETAGVENPVIVLYMNGLKAVRSRVVSANVGPEWDAYGLGDVNRDGIPDVYWRHKVAGHMVYWILNRDGYATGAHILDASGNPMGNAGISNSGPWRSVDIADFDGDSNDNIVWINKDTGYIATWSLNGATYKGSTNITTDILLAGNNYEYSGAVKLGAESGLRAIFQNRVATASDAVRGELRYIAPGNTSQAILGSVVNDLSWVILKSTKIRLP